MLAEDTFMFSPNDYDPNINQSILIAESGVTSEILIESLKLTTYPAPSANSKNMLASEVVIVLREFVGASLIDKIVTAADQLGIKNYLTCPYYIEVSFRANDPETGKPVMLDDYMYRWPISIQKMVSSVDIGGTTYNITGYHVGDLARKDELTSISRTFSYKTASKIQDVLNELSVNLTVYNAGKHGVTSFADEYKIFIDTSDPDMAAIANSVFSDPGKIRINPTTKNTLDISDFPSDKIEVSVEKNTPVIDAINRIITSSDEYKKRMLRSTSADNPDDTDPAELKMSHQIILETTYIGYDWLRNDYVREYVYKITKQENGLLTFTPKDVTANSTQRLFKYKFKNLIKKHYNYIFTGVNDQVIEFDLTFNNAWYAALPVNGGVNTSVSDARQGMNSMDMNIPPEVSVLMNEYYKNLPSLPENSIAADKNLAELREKVRVQLSDKTLDAKFKKAQRIKESNYIKSAGKNAVEELIPLSGGNRSTPLVKMRYRNTDFAADEVQLDANKSIEQPKGRGSKFVNSMFQQAFTGKNGDLVNVSMKIKGDPYWLGMTVNDSIEYFNKQVQIDGDSAITIPFCPKEAIDVGTVSFIFSVGSLKKPEEAVLRGSSVYNGLYIVKQIDHEFSDGLFTQTIQGALDTRIDVNGLISE